MGEKGRREEKSKERGGQEKIKIWGGRGEKRVRGK